MLYFVIFLGLAFKTNNFSCSAPIYYLFMLVSLRNATHKHTPVRQEPFKTFLISAMCAAAVATRWQHHEDVHHPATMLY